MVRNLHTLCPKLLGLLAFFVLHTTFAAAEPIRSHGISAFGDLKYDANFAQFDYATVEAPTGGTFSTGIGGITYDSLNPFILKGNPALGLSALLYDTLMTAAADEPDSMYGLIAHTIEYPENRSYAAFDLRPEARFTDGSPITAEDVVWTFETLMREGHPRYRVILAGVAQATVEGPHRVRFDFASDAARRDLPMAVASLPVLSKSAFSGKSFTEATEEEPIGSGPYVVAEADKGRTIRYTRNPNYWAADLPVNTGRYHFDEIRIEYYRDRSAAFEGFKAGTFTFNEEFWSKLWATGYDFPAVARGDIVRATLPDERAAGAQAYFLNLRREIFADSRVREAIALAFDFEWSNRTLFFGLYTRTDSFFEGGPMQAEGRPTPGELAVLEPLADQLEAEGLGHVLDADAYVPPTSDGSGRNRRNLRRASRLLDEAGWAVGTDGLRRNTGGETLSVEFLSDSPSFERITGPFVQTLRRIGVDATLRSIDPAQMERRTEEFDFDIVVARKAMGLTPGVELNNHFGSSSANASGSLNLSGVASPVVDALIARIERADSREDLASAVRALDRVLRAKHIWVPQWHKATHHLAYWDIYGRPPVEKKPRYARGVIDYWWIDPDKAAALAPAIGRDASD
ncbi:MAG: extracellular solute-binding protein [Paracoccaceae bacterium]